MSFGSAITSCFNQYAGFSGRARRSEFWWFALFAFLAEFAAAIVEVPFNTSILGIVVLLGLVLPSLAVTARRLHDTGRSGWWYFIGLVPLVGGIILLVFYCTDSQPEPNRFGPSPKRGRSQPPGLGVSAAAAVVLDAPEPVAREAVTPATAASIRAAGESHERAVWRSLRTFWARYQVGEPFGPGLGFERAVEKVSLVLADDPGQLSRLSDQQLTSLMEDVRRDRVTYDDWDDVLGLRWSVYRNQRIRRARFEAASRAMATLKELGSQQAQGRGDVLDRWRVDADFQREVLVWSVIIHCRLRESGKLVPIPTT